MRLYLLSVLCFLNPANGGWLRDFISPKGLHFGDGFILQLTNSRYPNSTFLERHSIIMDYKGYGLSLTKIPKRRAVELEMYTAQPEARGHKNSYFSLILGYKMATMITIVIAAMGVLVMKALMAAKLAVAISMFLLLGKLFHQKEETKASVEVEPPMDLHAEYSEIMPEVEYYPTGAGSYYQYSHLPPVIDYAFPEPSDNYTHPVVSDNQQVVKRRNGFKRKNIPLITIHEYSIKN